MKIKTKLIISFCIILFVPILLASITMYGFQNIQIKALERTYNLEPGSGYSLTNNLSLLRNLTDEDYEELQEQAAADPNRLTDADYLQEVQEELTEKCSYLVVKLGDQVIFNGGAAAESSEDSSEDADRDTESPSDEENANIIKNLDRVSRMAEANDDDSDEELQYMYEDTLIKQGNFTASDGREGHFYIMTTTRSTAPVIKSILMEMVFAVIMILILTAILLTVWLYSGIINPLQKLQAAAENIKEGNLDFELDTYREDEIGDLYVTFEQMRQRLKDNAEEKLANEKENRALISNIAHDLKTPITAVKGYSEGILDGVANTPEKVEKYVRTIYNKANDMDTLINELTLYAKIDTNRIPYNFARINVKDYFSDCVEEVGLDLEAKGIDLAYYNYVAENVEIIADPEQLRRVVHNIIGNSVKYMDKQHGTISIRIKDVGDFIQVEMEDNGRGIAPKDLPYIFDRFYRADASRNSATGGSGIGLSIVKKIIEDHGGKIWATSKEDTGTCMYFVIRKYQEVKNE